MALQTRIPRRLALVEAPTTRNVVGPTAADAAAPYRMMASQLDLFGQAAGEVAKAAAPAAGRQSVTRDENGNVVVNRLPVFGPASAPYERAVKMSAVAEAEVAINGDIARMRQEFKADPDSFEKAVQAYRQEKIGEYGKIAGDDVGLAVGTLINRAATWNLRGLTLEKTKKDAAAAGKRLKVSADDKADDLVAMMLGGATATPDFQTVSQDYAAVLDEAAGNGFVEFTPEQAQAHREQTAARGREAAIIGTARQAFEEGGVERLAGLRPQLEAIASPEERAALERRVAFDIGAKQAEAEAQTFARMRSEFAEQDARLAEGVAMLAGGAMDTAWLDRHAARIGRRNYETLRMAASVAPPSRDDPAVAADLTSAMLDGDGTDDAVTAYAAGQITRDTLAAVVGTAAQVKQDAAARPWANDLRRAVADRTKDLGQGALGEFGQLLATQPEITRAQAQEAADGIVEAYRDRDRRRMAATLPLPAGLSAPPNKPEQIDAVRATLAEQAKAGTATLSDIARNMTLLAQWRRTLKTEV